MSQHHESQDIGALRDALDRAIEAVLSSDAYSPSWDWGKARIGPLVRKLNRALRDSLPPAEPVVGDQRYCRRVQS